MLFKHTNKLITETSKYLLQHAHNPVNWYAWGSEALLKAKTENKIILVSIGYSACHWCHVMEKESFENEEIASIMNAHFINIKIDREERPDLDSIYMDAVQAITGSGGWPLNVFLTPDATPFYGGTYFPVKKAYNRSSWKEVINTISTYWLQNENGILTQAENLLLHLKNVNNLLLHNDTDAEEFFKKDICKNIADNILKNADKKWGGFGNPPKFLQAFTIQYLFQYYFYTKNNEALQQAILSIDKMITGGIYDQLGGGIARYSTDNEWLVPHFEKMLYDNAIFLTILCDAYQITKQEKYRNVIIKTINFVKRELLDKNGGFYAAIDADSEGKEGKYYLWTKDEILKLLKNDAEIFCAYYNITYKGNVPNEWGELNGENVLSELSSKINFANANGIKINDLENILNDGMHQLIIHRNSRIRPITDDKIILGWNALMVTALCKCAAALNKEEYIHLAEDTMAFLIKKFKKDNISFEFYHTYKKEKAKYNAFLDDYAYLIEACINLQEITSNTKYLILANNLTNFVNTNFSEPKSGHYYYTQKNQQDVIYRKIDRFDGATPSGNSKMVQNLFYLSKIFNNVNFKQIAILSIKNFYKVIEKHPTSYAVWSSIILSNSFEFYEIVITGKDFVVLRNELLAQYLPNKILQCSDKEQHEFVLLQSKNYNTKAIIYYCKQYSCKKPVYTVKELMKQICE